MEEGRMNVDLLTFGSNAVITMEDGEWLKILADELYQEGNYTKAIYLDAFVENSKRIS